MHNPQWLWTSLAAEGARRHGGGFNHRGVCALYTSLVPMTAILEVSQLGRPFQPAILCAYEVDAEPVFDAKNKNERQLLGVQMSDLECPDWEAEMLAGMLPVSQKLANRLISKGFVGMLVRSFASGTCGSELNLVMWKWGEKLPACVRLIDDESRLLGLKRT
ncbi:MAG: RES domain-containing protein [Gammaproteobacteria bacterium]|nr:RES domain-containing protein [Gammaproteobacteria bacterium]